MENKQEKLIKIIKIVIPTFGLIFFAFLIYNIFFDHSMDYFWIMFVGGSLFIVSFTIFIVVYGIKAAKEYRMNLIATKPKRKVKYLDSFYYYNVYSGGADETSSRETVIFHIFQDIESQKLYAISGNETNILFQKILDKTTLFRNDKTDGFSTRKDWKEINFGDVGSLWLDKELVGCYQNDGERITIDYLTVKRRVKIDKMYNINQNYNISLLDKVIFITGYVELNSK